jgi:hypothetical protein
MSFPSVARLPVTSLTTMANNKLQREKVYCLNTQCLNRRKIQTHTYTHERNTIPGIP